ncbi:MAG: hypothetical protein PHC66_01645 [Candidatus Nanoarchaeia archaeon]|nr:hypothetical protein [Candidatus Nanoarchaeia archaeon]MDD5238916.1 hypothetical protein [Candidatus Nanoarchaeia archaeon]
MKKLPFDLVSKLSYFYTTPDKEWDKKDTKLFYDITRIISKDGTYVQDDTSMNSWTKRSKRKIKPPNYLERAVLDSCSELNKFRTIQNPDSISCELTKSRLVCIKTKDEGGIVGAYFIGFGELEEKLREAYSKKK